MCRFQIYLAYCCAEASVLALHPTPTLLGGAVVSSCRCLLDAPSIRTHRRLPLRVGLQSNLVECPEMLRDDGQTQGAFCAILQMPSCRMPAQYLSWLGVVPFFRIERECDYPRMTQGNSSLSFDPIHGQVSFGRSPQRTCDVVSGEIKDHAGPGTRSGRAGGR